MVQTSLFMHGSAYFSPDRKHRYALFRTWEEGKQVNFIGLNPSTATETVDDPTIRRCIRFAQAWGYGCLVMTNIFALRSTDPAGLKADAPVGPENDESLVKCARESDLVVCAWGVHGEYLERGKQVETMLREIAELRVFDLTRKGFPRHPLYLPKTAMHMAWNKINQL